MDWGELVGEAFKFWITGEPAKTFVIRRLKEQLALSHGHGDEPFKELFGACIREANERIAAGAFPQPPDWLFSITNFLTACRILDRQQVMQDPAKLHVFTGMMEALASRLAQPGRVGTSVREAVMKAADEVHADIVLLGRIENLRKLADGLNDRGKVTLVIDVTQIDQVAEGAKIALSAIRNARHAIAIFQVEGMPQHKEIIEELMKAKQAGKAVAFVPAPTADVGSMMRIL
jgi:hypothetical protein